MHPFKLYRLRDGRPVKVLGESDVADKLRLMNAAPDLLAAAHRGIAALAANGAPNCEAVKELRAAIAKAEGK